MAKKKIAAKNTELRLNRWVTTDYDDTSDNPFVEYFFRVHEKISHERRIQYFMDEDYFEVIDKFYSEDALERNVTLFWHFPPHVSIHADKNTVRLEGKNRISGL